MPAKLAFDQVQTYPLAHLVAADADWAVVSGRVAIRAGVNAAGEIAYPRFSHGGREWTVPVDRLAEEPLCA